MEHVHQWQDRQRLQERLQLVPRGMDEAYWDWDLLTGEVYFSERWWTMLGYTVDELPSVATLWARFCHPDDAKSFDDQLTQALNGDADVFQMDHRLKHKQGHYLPVHSRAHIRRNAQGKAIRMSGSNVDKTAHQWFEHQLHETEGRYRALVEWSPLGVCVHQRGQIAYANPAALAIFGAHSLEEVIGSPIMDRVHPDFRAIVMERVANSLAHKTPMPWNTEKMLRMDGSELHVEIQGTPITHLGEPAIQVTLIDCSARMHTEARQRESEARFRALTELTSDWYWEQDEQFRFIRISESFRPDSRLVKDNGLGLKRWELPHSGVTEEQWAAHRLVLQAHRTFHDFEMLRPGRDGSWVWISVSGVPIFDSQGTFKGYWGMGRDITQRKNAESTLRESQTQYQDLVEWSSVALTVHQHGRITYANPAALRLWGATRVEDLVGTSIEARFHPEHRESTLERLRTMSDKGQHTPMRESKFLKLDGRSIDVELQGMPISYRGQPAIQISFQDITARKQIEKTLRESEERFRTLTQLSSDWYWEQDANFRFVLLSGDVAAGTGLSAQDHLGKTHWDLPTLNLSETDWERHRAGLAAHHEFRDFEIRRPDSGKRMHWASISGTPMFDSKGAFRGYRGIGRDVSTQKQAAEQIHRLAFYDALTSLPNRRFLLERLKKSVQINARHHMRGALLFIDLDNFKTLNDTLGHDVGDVLLQQVATRLVGCVREVDTVARLGGDEFVVVLEDLDENALDAATQADFVGQKILAALNMPYQLAGREHRSSPSIGITLLSASVSSVDDLLKQADLAMYQAKAAGRNTMRFFDVAMQSEVDCRVALESDLRDGLQGGEELVLHFQPIVGADGRVTGAEALVRWLQPLRGLVMPEDFVPLAEATGLILPLGRWVMQSACEQLNRWAQQPHTAHLTLAVNVSARELREPKFVTHVMQCLERSGARPHHLRLELTESVLAHKVDDIIVKMNELRAHGVGFSLDDFGTGYSSLSYLKQLPLDLLKIDQSFVRDVLTDPNDAAIARTIVALGQSLGLSVMAEGVETDAQRAFLADSGCLAYQGHLFGRPMDSDAFEDFLQEQRKHHAAVPFLARA